MSNVSNLKIMYLRDKTNQPVGCVAFRRVPSQDGQHLLEYELSVRNPVDRFSRKMGREIATGRLNTHPREIRVPELMSGQEASRQVLRHISQAYPIKNLPDGATMHTRDMLPARAIKAAQIMLGATKRFTGPDRFSVTDV